MSEMVERVAQAIFDWEYRDPRRAVPDIEPHWKLYEGAARAAIEAMRGPTEDMVRAGGDIDNSNRIAVETWHAMIDEALK